LRLISTTLALSHFSGLAGSRQPGAPATRLRPVWRRAARQAREGLRKMRTPACPDDTNARNAVNRFVRADTLDASAT